MTVPADRRERQRAATAAEIKTTARRQVAETGAHALSLRGIAREMGMTAPGLYRYFTSLDDLVEDLCQDYFAEMNEAVLGAVAEAGEEVGPRVRAALRSFRRWAVANPAEFGLMFRDRGTTDDTNCPHTRRFAGLFLGLFVQLWERQPFQTPDDDVVPDAAFKQLDRYALDHGVELPRPALWVFARSWVRLYGVICMEVLGQLSFMFTDPTPYFEAELSSVTRALGLDPEPAG